MWWRLRCILYSWYVALRVHAWRPRRVLYHAMPASCYRLSVLISGGGAIRCSPLWKVIRHKTLNFSKLSRVAHTARQQVSASSCCPRVVYDTTHRHISSRSTAVVHCVTRTCGWYPCYSCRSRKLQVTVHDLRQRPVITSNMDHQHGR